MAEKSLNAYLINFISYEENDHILTFIFENSKIISMISKGSQKTLSKNGRFLLFSSLFEVEFFASRKIDKLSRLKKIKPIRVAKLLESYHPIIIFFNKYLIISNLKFFEFNEYSKLIEIAFEYDNFTCLLFCLKLIFKNEGLKLVLNKCCVCHRPNIYSFSLIKKGFLCKNCFNEEINFKTSKLFNQTLFFLFENDFKSISLIESETKLKVAKMLTSFLYEAAGIFLDLKFLLNL